MISNEAIEKPTSFPGSLIFPSPWRAIMRDPGNEVVDEQRISIFEGSPSMGSLHDPVTWCGINYAGTQIKALANEDTLVRAHCCQHKCFPACPLAQHLLRTQKMFLTLFRNILCPQQMFPSLRAQGIETSGATLFPQQCVLVCQYLNAVGLPRQRNSYQSSPTFLCFESLSAFCVPALFNP